MTKIAYKEITCPICDYTSTNGNEHYGYFKTDHEFIPSRTDFVQEGCIDCMGDIND